MPVFNGATTIGRSLDSLVQQDFKNWKLVVSDNCSQDATLEIVEKYAQLDHRISYCRQLSNIGAQPNFVYLLAQADTPYFMWAAADDEWSSGFLSEAVRLMEEDSSIKFCSPSVELINADGKKLVAYKSFDVFSDFEPMRRLNQYLSMIEVVGKANPIYSLYRTDFCRALCGLPRIFEGWGFDMAFVAAGLCRGNYGFISGSVLRKRVVSERDVATSIIVASGRFSCLPFGGEFPLNLAHEYFAALFRAAPTVRLKFIVASVMGRRLLSMIFRLATGRMRWRL
jgi:glycosyltransferase involved in cell wall biosynthesis